MSGNGSPTPDPVAMARAVEAHMKTLSALAVELAVTAPDVRRAGSKYGFVPWSLIERTRETCEAIGLDWRTLRQQAIVQASLGAMVAEGEEASDD